MSDRTNVRRSARSRWVPDAPWLVAGSAGRLRRRSGGDACMRELSPMTRQTSEEGGPIAGGSACATRPSWRRVAVGSSMRLPYEADAIATTLSVTSTSAMRRPPPPQTLEHSRATARAGGVESESGTSRALTTRVRSGTARSAWDGSRGALARDPAGVAIMPATQIPISADSARPHQSRLTPTKVANRPRTRQHEVAPKE